MDRLDDFQLELVRGCSWSVIERYISFTIKQLAFQTQCNIETYTETAEPVPVPKRPKSSMTPIPYTKQPKSYCPYFSSLNLDFGEYRMELIY
jgi:hypothetical protein